MTRARVCIPAEATPDCACCARRHGWYDFACRSCLGRYVRSLQRQYRQSWYREAAAVHGHEAVEAFIADSINTARRSA
jgi:hypothetical protein